ncbi:HNH endonuclease [Fontivita pretiosa]|uniref:HNH endonuclease n=1 Tax=Fontivita pretiosa TaxID=2989684 RepID=UPI003D175BEC
MPETAEQTIRRLAAGRCEYCRMPESGSRLRHVLDHIIARQHGGKTEVSNLALCCGRCNQFKGPNLAGIDPETGQISRLFHPRTDSWDEHFRYEGAALVGLTPIGRATVAVSTFPSASSSGNR